MKRSSVRPSVCLSVHPFVYPVDRQQQQRPAGFLPSALRAENIDRLLHGAPAAGAVQHAPAHGSNGAVLQADVGSVTLTADRGG